MSVKLNTRQVGDVAVIDISGWITLGERFCIIRDAIRLPGNQRKQKIC